MWNLGVVLAETSLSIKNSWFLKNIITFFLNFTNYTIIVIGILLLISELRKYMSSIADLLRAKSFKDT